MKRRDRLAVIHDLLKIIREHNNSIRPTPLLRLSNLSSQRFAGYYAELLQKGFIKEIRDVHKKRFVTLTDKGFKYVENYATIIGFIDDFNL